MNKSNNINKSVGFTLIEMLIVIMIIVILIAIAVPAISGYRRDAEETADMAAVRTLQTALEAASIKVDPSELTGSTYNFTSSNVDLENLPDDDFSAELKEMLGEGFTGKFRFGYHRETGSIRWVSWWDEDSSENGVMVYDLENGHFGYLVDIKENYPHPEYYGPSSTTM